ncbi:hypothetical protein PG984_014891 [Apiospora sp. TS-2023a]
MFLLSLPVELLIEIICEHGLEPVDLAHLASLHSALYQIAIPHLYKNDIQHGRSHCLMWAARNGSLRTLTNALDYGADPNMVGPDEADTENMLKRFADLPDFENIRHDMRDVKEYGTPLHFAAKAGYNDIVAALLDAGANVHAVSRGLCKCRFHHTLQLTDNDGEPEVPLPNWLPLHHAVCHGHLSTANLLLDRGASLQMCYEPRASKDLPKLPSLVHCAAANGLETLVQRALDTDVRTALRGDSDMDSPLEYALETWDNEGVIKRLVAAGHNINNINKLRRQTAVRRACQVKNYAAALNMLRAGADPRSPATNWEPSLIKDYDFDVDEPFKVDVSGWDEENSRVILRTSTLTPLHLALLHGEAVPDDRVINEHIVKLLLELGADANKQAFGGDDPLTLALKPVFDLIAVWEEERDSSEENSEEESEEEPEEEPEKEERDTPEVISDHMLETVGLLLDAGARLINRYKDEKWGFDIKYGPLDRVVKVAGPAPEQHQGRRLLEYVMSRATTANITEDELDEFCDNVLQNNDQEPATTILREKRRLFPPEASSDTE